MTFVTANSCRPQLERLTQILVGAFPGSTIYQHTELMCVLRDVLNHKVDAVLLEGEMSSLDLMQKLHRQRPDIPFFIISTTDRLYDEAIESGAAHPQPLSVTDRLERTVYPDPDSHGIRDKYAAGEQIVL